MCEVVADCVKGIWLAQALEYPPRPMDELKNWEGAGPKVWTG